ncbi:MAG: hypothetical protein H6Q66_110 [Firmicutes bacterium]|nr:hypothetical protein [Bacillota bacterium]
MLIANRSIISLNEDIAGLGAILPLGPAFRII